MPKSTPKRNHEPPHPRRGPAGVVAAETLRALDSAAGITVIGDEAAPPYSRMAIPYLLREDIEERGTYLRKQAGHFDARNIEVRQDRAQAVDVAAKKVRLAGGDELAFDKLLLATGSKPLTPPIPGIDDARVCHCWTLSDARTIAAGITPGAPVVLIGAGFIGCIILEALVAAGAQLTVVEMGARMVPRMLDATCGGLLQKWCAGKGVAVLTGAQVSAIEPAGDSLKVRVDGGDGERVLDAALVISATGVRATPTASVPVMASNSATARWWWMISWRRPAPTSSPPAMSRAGATSPPASIRCRRFSRSRSTTRASPPTTCTPPVQCNTAARWR